MDALRSRLIAGLIAIVATAVIVSVLVMVANGAFSDDYRLTARTTKAGFGLDRTSEVKIRGVAVGKVAGISVTNDGIVQLTFRIDKHVHIPVDATATIEPLSVFGPKFVDVDPGPHEAGGPFHTPGSSLGAVVAPTELGDTLTGLDRLLQSVDPNDLATIVSELARGLDGLGPQVGGTVDAANSISARLDAKSAQIGELVAHARQLAATLDSHRDSLNALSVNSQSVLRTIATNDDALGGLLTDLNELAVRGNDLVGAIGDNLSPTLTGLQRGADVLVEQLRFLPDFIHGLDAVSALLGTGLLKWDRGNGQWGGIGHGVLDFAPCAFMADARCPPRPGYPG